jgi:hypothetical protein
MLGVPPTPDNMDAHACMLARVCHGRCWSGDPAARSWRDANTKGVSAHIRGGQLQRGCGCLDTSYITARQILRMCFSKNAQTRPNSKSAPCSACSAGTSHWWLGGIFTECQSLRKSEDPLYTAEVHLAGSSLCKPSASISGAASASIAAQGQGTETWLVSTSHYLSSSCEAGHCQKGAHMHVVLPFLLPKTKMALLRGFCKSCLRLRAAIAAAGGEGLEERGCFAGKLGWLLKTEQLMAVETLLRPCWPQTCSSAGGY